MATYSVHAQCSACTGVHPLAVIIEIVDGPEQTASLTEATEAHPLLGELSDHLHCSIFCKRTHDFVRQRDDSKIYLVPELN